MLFRDYVISSRKHTLGFSTLQFALQCHDIVEVIQFFQILSVSCSYERYSTELSVVRICQFSGTVLCTCPELIRSFSSQHRLKFFRSILDDNFMPLQMIMRATEGN